MYRENRFICTDLVDDEADIELNSLKQALYLLYAADKYQVLELIEKCYDFINGECVKSENIFLVFDCANRFNKRALKVIIFKNHKRLL